MELNTDGNAVQQESPFTRRAKFLPRDLTAGFGGEQQPFTGPNNGKLSLNLPTTVDRMRVGKSTADFRLLLYHSDMNEGLCFYHESVSSTL